MIIAAVLVLLLVLIVVRWYINNIFDRIEAILSGDRNIVPVNNIEDTRESKLLAKAEQLFANSQKNYLQADLEKQAVKTLIGDLSHQLKTPLANLIMYTELLQQDNLIKEEQKEFILRTRSETEKIQWLMQTLIKMSRLETDVIQFNPEDCYLKETLAESISAVYSAAVMRNISIMICDFKDIKVKHNRKWTKEAIGNILENAIKYSPQDSEITITVTRMDIYARVDIKDKGMGIPKEDYNNIFKRFYRGERMQEYPGSGIGLYLSQLILTKENGYVTVSSKVDEGSCFSVFLLKSKE